MEKKFNILGAEQLPTKKSFTSLATPKILPKPTVIIGQVALRALQKNFIVTGEEIEDQSIGTSKIFNQPIYSDLTFSSGSYVDQNNLTQVFQELNIELVLISVMNTKNIIETTLQGRNGTVKEYISDGDYQIRIQGTLYGQGMNNYPEGDVQKLHDICLAPQSLSVTSSFLKMFNIENIVIKSYNIDQQEGMRNCQPFTLNCVSDVPLILLKNA